MTRGSRANLIRAASAILNARYVAQRQRYREVHPHVDKVLCETTSTG